MVHLDRNKYITVFNFLSALQDLLPADVQSKVLLVLLYLAKNEGCSHDTLSKDLGFSQSAASRCVATLSSIGYKRSDSRTKGLGLVAVHNDINDMRKKTIHLTPAGKEIMQALFSRIENNKEDEG